LQPLRAAAVSGKTEAFLLPVIQNAWEDAAKFKKSGLTAILVYPMNALANDQEQRIADYLEEAGFAGSINVAKYDRGTSQADREKLRKNPPHILLTNYMMLEYLLVRPNDREAIFANHRCRFLVLEEVHTYPLKVTMVPARTRCVCCGGTAGSWNVITPVSLGTSAAVKVVGEGLDGRRRMGVATEPERASSLGQRRQAADTEGP